MKTILIIMTVVATALLILSGSNANSATDGVPLQVEPPKVHTLDTRAVQPRYMFEVQQ